MHDPQNANSLAADIVVTIYQDSEKTLWIGCLGGLTRFDSASNTFTNYFHKSGDLTSIPSRSNYSPGIYEDSSGNFWIGNAVPASLSLFDRKQGKVIKNFLPDPANPHAIPDAQQVNQVEEDKQEPTILWLPTFKGLVKFDKKTEQFIRYGRNNIWYILQDRPGRILASTWGNGLAIFEKASGHFQYLRHHPNDPDSISSNLTIPIFKDASSRIWVGAENGLNLFNPESNTFKSYGRHNGFPWDAMHSIGQDQRGNLWLGTTATGEGDSSCFWRIETPDLEKGGKTEFGIVLKIPKTLSKFEFTGLIIAEPDMQWLTANLRDVFSALNDRLKTFLSGKGKDRPIVGDHERWIIELDNYN